MAEFSADILKAEDLTIISVGGSISAKEILDFSQKLHGEPEVTRLFLWDAREASMECMTADELRQMGLKMKGIVRNRPDGKTAIVAGSDLSFGFGRLYSTQAEIESIAVRYRIFRSIEDAMSWLAE